jgi:hypothetical protein
LVQNARKTLQDPKLFLAHLMTYGTLEDIATGMKYYADTDFDLVLKDPPAGIFDRRSWNYWNLRYHHVPVPPLNASRETIHNFLR